MKKIYFTLENAQKFIPLIKSKIKTLQDLKESISLLSTVEIDFQNDTYENYIHFIKVNKEFHKLVYTFYKELEEIESVGCVVKDIDSGLVDFFHYFEGRDVFLCWKLGEDKIGHWHEIDTGYEGRKPIVFLEEIRK